jgi:hypothetical protein
VDVLIVGVAFVVGALAMFALGRYFERTYWR